MSVLDKIILHIGGLFTSFFMVAILIVFYGMFSYLRYFLVPFVPTGVLESINILILPLFIMSSLVIIMIGLRFDKDDQKSKAMTVKITLIDIFKENGISKTYLMLAFIGLMLISIGIGMHNVANYLWFSALSKNIQNYSKDFMDEIYFFDEIVSH